MWNKKINRDNTVVPPPVIYSITFCSYSYPGSIKFQKY